MCCWLSRAIFDYMAAVIALGHCVMQGIALSLHLPAEYFASRYTADPLVLFCIFQYPTRTVPAGLDVRHGVGEHTYYGLLTLLRQADVGGLQVPTRQGWIDALPVPESFVCNIGDMLDRMTGGLYRSTPNRVALNHSGRHRLSFPCSSTPISMCASSLSAIPKSTTAPHAGTEPACTRSKAPTATTC